MSEEEILERICDILKADKDVAKTKTRLSPYPYVRGFYWRVLKILFAYTNDQIIARQSSEWHKFRNQTITMAISKVTKASSYNNAWKEIWEKIAEQLNLPKLEKRDLDIKFSVSVPYGMKDFVKLDIVERRRNDV